MDAISGFFLDQIAGTFFHGWFEGSIRVVAMRGIKFMEVFVLICVGGHAHKIPEPSLNKFGKKIKN